MPSPFPGMDPYLEGSLWTTLHATLPIEIVRQLIPQLGPTYMALPVERMVLEMPEDVAIMAATIIPDASVVTTGPSYGSGAATLEAPLHVTTLIPTPVPHVSIEIRDTRKRELVTAIEILSPTNKRGDGRQEYLAKRRQILLSTAHLIEIDLLRRGQRVPVLERLPEVPYFVYVSRFEARPISDVWPIRLQDPLPIVPVPLRHGDPDISLDLQAAFTGAYDLLQYGRGIDYHQPPEIPLDSADAAWVAALGQQRDRATR